MDDRTYAIEDEKYGGVYHIVREKKEEELVQPKDRITLKNESVSGTVLKVKEFWLIVKWDDCEHESVVPTLSVRNLCTP